MTHQTNYWIEHRHVRPSGGNTGYELEGENRWAVMATVEHGDNRQVKYYVTGPFATPVGPQDTLAEAKATLLVLRQLCPT